jgi:hypothetical protein
MSLVGVKTTHKMIFDQINCHKRPWSVWIQIQIQPGSESGIIKVSDFYGGGGEGVGGGRTLCLPDDSMVNKLKDPIISFTV